MKNNINLTNIINNFYTEKNSETAIMTLLKIICSTCLIDKLTVMIYDKNKSIYLKAYDYDSKNGFDNFMTEIKQEASDFVNVSYYKNNINPIEFKCLFNDNNYIYNTNYSEVKDILKTVGFKSQNEENINDFYIFLIQTSPEELFTYYVFERYDKTNLSQDEVDFISMFCELINNRIKNIVNEQRYLNDLLMRDVIINTEEIPMITIEKETKMVSYVNSFFLELLPEVKVGDVNKKLNSIIKNYSIRSNNNITLVSGTNGDTRKWLRKVTPIQLSTGKEAYMIYYKNSTDYIDELNKVDDLTKALLISGFEDFYNAFIKLSPYKYALCSLDIDKFKYINSMFGYEVGDNVLKKVSRVIHNFINPNETFCRIGEDKFSIFFSYDTELQLHSKLTKLSKLFEVMRDKYFSDAKITVVNGVTLVNKDLSLNALLDQSATARKSAKGSHKNKFSYYNIEWDLKLQKEIEIEEQVPHAIANDEFTIFLQPKFDLNTKEICGAEALVRWITPKGMIFPDQFIPLFERNDFIITLDFIVYEKTMEYIRRCLDQNLKVYPISVNVSRNHIKDPHFMYKFMDLINKYNIPRQYLELEVTESIFIEDRKELKKFIDKIKEEDLKVSVDDFGTAYSSLQTLTDINIDILKIDKGFLDNVENTKDDSYSKDKILIKNIIILAKELDFIVLCEGIETEEQIQFLKNLGCDLGQGYVFARPMPLDEYNQKYIIN
ncbi:MAG: bifunctional diguanylate cyclase/phosphodiesterase [bacterium]